MNISIKQGDMPISRNNSSSPSGNGPPPPSHNLLINCPISPITQEDNRPYKKVVRYKECLKNHAAAIGGNATDGCGEFMPSGEEGTLEALKCSACNCHRNFHRKEIEGAERSFEYCYHPSPLLNNGGTKSQLNLDPHKGMHMVGPELLGYPTGLGTLIRAAAPPPQQMMMSYRSGSVPSESDEQDGGGGGVVARPAAQVVKKRFRTKFSQEQKEKMLRFAEKAEWRIQKLEESVVQQFCQEIGIKRRVLKVWMHNNKHNLAEKKSTSTC
ncbi:hypothetical protein L1049_020354 [Liquidambar formosana]|uniref:ZF-HD dimerization-type domain-containing protein n=1 Tax=Liquidambar formosana TaxID=63359 RepID=A0AAP0X7A9_LIQFO